MPVDQTSAVEIDGVSRRFGETPVLRDIRMRIEPNRFHCLLGPSGCGKTTLLRILSGLDMPDQGRVLIGGVDHTRTAPHRRPTNLVFQSGALFPHLSVADNVAFGLRSDRVRGAELRRRVTESLELVAMGDFAGRSPATLSGGQRQRVAIARSLVKRPAVLLLDEPLSALDLGLQLHMRRELRRWQQETGTTFVCVTHNQAEAMEMADEVAVMRDGQVEQTASAQELYARPASRFVAAFIGENNIFDVPAHHRGDLVVDGIGFPGVVAGPGDSVAVRPEHLTLVPADDPAANGRVVVETVGFTGRTLRVGLLTTSGRELLAEVDAGTAVQAGSAMGVRFATRDVVLLPAHTRP